MTPNNTILTKANTMTKSEHAKQQAELRDKIQELQIKLASLNNIKPTPEPFNFEPLVASFHSLSFSLSNEFRKQGFFFGNVLTVRAYGEYAERGIYLGNNTDSKCEIVTDSKGAQVLIPPMNKIKEDDDSEEDDI